MVKVHRPLKYSSELSHIILELSEIPRALSGETCVFELYSKTYFGKDCRESLSLIKTLYLRFSTSASVVIGLTTKIQFKLNQEGARCNPTISVPWIRESFLKATAR